LFGLFAVLLALVVGLTGLIVGSEPDPETARIQEARRILRASGIHYPKDSPEEVRAIRIIIEGGPISEC